MGPYRALNFFKAAQSCSRHLESGHSRGKSWDDRKTSRTSN
jgi:hypothetical protein